MACRVTCRREVKDHEPDGERRAAAADRHLLRRGILIFDIEFVGLTSFDIKFVGLSKYDIGHANSFETGDFVGFSRFRDFH